MALPPAVVAQIRSSTTITSLNGTFIELLKNALDAKATKIHADIDYLRGSCVIEDDGRGILSAEFEEAGGLGRLHCTLPSTPCGDSILTIASRHIQIQRKYPNLRSPWRIPSIARIVIFVDNNFSTYPANYVEHGHFPPFEPYIEVIASPRRTGSVILQSWNARLSPRFVWKHACKGKATRNALR